MDDFTMLPCDPFWSTTPSITISCPNSSKLNENDVMVFFPVLKTAHVVRMSTSPGIKTEGRNSHDLFAIWYPVSRSLGVRAMVCY
jgi:hypothetical protein